MKNNELLLSLLLAGKTEDLEKALKENIREEANKAAGTKKEATLIKALLKNCKDNKSLQGCIEKSNGCYFCDGYRIYKAATCFGFDKLENNNMAVDVMTDNAKNTCNVCIELDIANIKEFIALEKANKKANKNYTIKPYIIKYNDIFIGVNAIYLLECLQFVNDNKIYINTEKQATKNGCYIVPMYFNNNEKEAILLPINIHGNENNIANYEVVTKEKVNQNNENETEKDFLQEKEETISILEDVKNEIQSGKNSFSIVDRYDCFLSIMEDITDSDSMKNYDHINYKLYNYGYVYHGYFNEKTYNFEYRQINENVIKKRILLKVQIACENFINDIKLYREKTA